MEVKCPKKRRQENRIKRREGGRKEGRKEGRVESLCSLASLARSAQLISVCHGSHQLVR